MSVLKFFRPKTKARLLRGERVHWIENNARSEYIRKVVLSFPDWADREALARLWDRCREEEKKTGERHVLDHIVPVTHPFVCGLSVPWNMRVIPYRCNATKGNKFHPDQNELFPSEEERLLFARQLSLWPDFPESHL